MSKAMEAAAAPRGGETTPAVSSFTRAPSPTGRSATYRAKCSRIGSSPCSPPWKQLHTWPEWDTLGEPATAQNGVWGDTVPHQGARGTAKREGGRALALVRRATSEHPI